MHDIVFECICMYFEFKLLRDLVLVFIKRLYFIFSSEYLTPLNKLLCVQETNAEVTQVLIY